MNPEQTKWDEIYRNADPGVLPDPAHVLRAYDHLLPSRGLAIDLACGLGANAAYLAKSGLETQAWDLSPVAVAYVNQTARREQLNLVAEVRDLECTPLPVRNFDVIVIIRFLHRRLSEAVVDALRPGGLLYFQSFVRDKDPRVGPRNPEYLLAENELLKMFSALVIRAYAEAGRTGDCSRGLRNEAFLVAQKPDSINPWD
jgi:tellurite methyltransferase